MPVWSFLCVGRAVTSISDVVLFWTNVNVAKNVKVIRWHEIPLPPTKKPFYIDRGQKSVHLTWKEVSRGDMAAPYGGLMRWLQSRTTKQTWNFLSVNYKLRKTPRRDQCDLNVCLFLFRNWVLFKISRHDPHDNWVSLSSGRSCQCPSGAFACDHLLSMPCRIWHHKTKHRNKALEIVGVSKVGEF